MKIKLGDLNLRISNDVSREPPDWFNTELEFEFPRKVQAGNIVLIKEYDWDTVVVLWLWESWEPSRDEARIGEVYFVNKGTDLTPKVLSTSRLINQDEVNNNMIDNTLMKEVAKGMFALKEEYEDGRMSISHHVQKAEDFIRKYSFEKIGAFSNDDTSILEEARNQLRKGNAVFIIAYADRQEYELYAHPW